MSIFGLPDLLHQVGVDVGDLEYIEGKVLAGNYFQESGDINASGNTIEFVVPTGKTAFLIEAGFKLTSDNPIPVPTNTSLVTHNRITSVLKINSVIKDKLRIGDLAAAIGNVSGAATGRSGGGGQYTSKFQVLGLSLVGDGIKKIEIENVADSGSGFATMSGYLV